MIEERLQSMHQAIMLELQPKLHLRMDDFTGRVLIQIIRIEMSNLGDIREEVDLLRPEVCSITESNISAIPPVISPVVQPFPLSGP